MTQDHKELLSPAINMVDAQIKKIRMSVDRTGSSKAKGYPSLRNLTTSHIQA